MSGYIVVSKVGKKNLLLVYNTGEKIPDVDLGVGAKVLRNGELLDSNGITITNFSGKAKWAISWELGASIPSLLKCDLMGWTWLPLYRIRSLFWKMRRRGAQRRSREKMEKL